MKSLKSMARERVMGDARLMEYEDVLIRDGMREDDAFFAWVVYTPVDQIVSWCERWTAAEDAVLRDAAAYHLYWAGVDRQYIPALVEPAWLHGRKGAVSHWREIMEYERDDIALLAKTLLGHSDVFRGGGR